MKTNSQPRLWYVDNLRIFLISLVVLLHFNITYGGPGDWYYRESEAGFPEIILQAMFNITNQSFFMGMFFFISLFFTASSLKKKSVGRFVKDRLLRLGIPMVIFYFILNPLTNFIIYRFIRNEDVTLWGFITNQHAWGFGPMWFVEALLLFSLIYLVLRSKFNKIRIEFPVPSKIIIAAVFIGLLQFFIRIWLPVGWSQPFTNFQFPFFLQYIFLFFFGIVAFQNNWLESISFKTGKRFFIFSQVLILLILPILLYFGGKENGMEPFVGGGTWQSFSWAIWEQVTGFSLIIGLLGLFKKYFNSQGGFTQNLSASAYGVFIIHPPVIVGISAIFVHWEINQLLKLIALAPVALTVTFLIAWLLKQIPGLKSII